MNYKEEILKALVDLTEFKMARREIEKELNYSNKYIDQQLSKGGNEKLLNGLRQLLEKKRLHNATAPSNDTTLQLSDGKPYHQEGDQEQTKGLEALIEVVIKSIHYGSPGFFDFFGFGKIFEQISEIIKKVILIKATLEAERWNLIEDKIESIVGIWEKVDKIDIDARSKKRIRASLAQAIYGAVPFIQKGLITGSTIVNDGSDEAEFSQTPLE